jgi:hypothetical protein
MFYATADRRFSITHNSNINSEANLFGRMRKPDQIKSSSDLSFSPWQAGSDDLFPAIHSGSVHLANGEKSNVEIWLSLPV